MSRREHPRRVQRSARTLWSVLLFLAGVAHHLSAVASEPRVTQLAHTAWRSRNGDIPDAANSLAQTTDGQLWVGTESGLLKFDGIRFSPWHAAKGEDPDIRVFSLQAAKDGSLWVGTGSGLFRVRNNVSTRIIRGRINQIKLDRDDGAWFARSRQEFGDGGLCHVLEETPVCSKSVPFNGQSIAGDVKDGVWFTTTDGSLVRWTEQSPANHANTIVGRDEPLQAQAVASSPDGTTLVAMQRKGQKPFLRRFSGAEPKDIALPLEADASTSINVVFVDKDRSIWVGTTNQGLLHLNGSVAEHFGEHDGLSSDEVADVYRDAEENLWVATSGGLDSFHSLPIETWSKREGLTTDSVSSVFAGRDGTVWFGNLGGLDFLRDGVVHSIRSGSGLPGSVVGSLLVDSKDRLWLGLESGLWVYDGVRFTEIRTKDKKSVGQIYSFAEDRDHTIWARSSGVLHIREGAIDETFKVSAVAHAMNLTAAADGGVWLSTRGGGLIRINNGQLTEIPVPGYPAKVPTTLYESEGYLWSSNTKGISVWRAGVLHTLSKMNGLDCGPVYTMVRDAQGNAWLMTTQGYARIDHAELAQWLANFDTKVHPACFDRSEGAQPAFATFDRASVVAPNGDIWFATDHVAQRIIPSEFKATSRRPPVIIDRLEADGKSYPLSEAAALPPGSRDIAISYTALSYLNPRRVRFRYRLVGWDKEWQDADIRREAFYTNLPPGHYTFHVSAANSSGVWNEQGATTDFEVRPHWYQRRSVQGCAFGLLVLSAWLMYRFRVHSLRLRFREKAEARMAERERIARDLHDTLLQGTQGLLLRFAAIRLRLPENHPLRDPMQEALEGSERIIDEGRERIHALRVRLKSFEELPIAIQSAVSDLEAQYQSIPFELDIIGEPYPIPGETCEELFLITRELLANAFKHSQASTVSLKLEFLSDCLRLEVSDDGIGLPSWATKGDAQAGRLGLKGVRERAGAIGSKLLMNSADSGGTKVTLVLPTSTSLVSRAKRLAQRFREWFSTEELA